MTAILRATALVALSTTVLAAQSVVGRDDASYDVREPLQRGQTLQVTSPNGAITVTQGSGSAVEIHIEKVAGRGSSIRDIAFIVRRGGDGLIVCAVYDDDDQCDMEHGYRQSRRRHSWNWQSPKANFTVRLPAGALVRANTGNGDVSLNGLASDVDIHTGNGKVLVDGTEGRVKVNTSNGRVTIENTRGEVDVHSGNGRILVGNAEGTVRASTGNGDVSIRTANGPVTVRSGNGDIDIAMENVARTEPMNVSTGNGSIVLSVPANFGAELESSTGSGSITTELPMQVQGRIDRQRVRGILGRGGERLTVSTGSGNIRIQRAN